MREKKKELHIKICVVVVIVLFLILFFNGQGPKAASLLFLSGGILGLITKTDPFVRISKNPFISTKVCYDDDSIAGPVKNIFIIIIGLICLGI